MRHTEQQHANASLYWCGQKSLIYAAPAAGHSITNESVDTSTAKRLSEIHMKVSALKKKRITNGGSVYIITQILTKLNTTVTNCLRK